KLDMVLDALAWLPRHQARTKRRRLKCGKDAKHGKQGCLAQNFAHAGISQRFRHSGAIPPCTILWLGREDKQGLFSTTVKVARSKPLFVRRCHGVLGSSRACDESANQKTEGQSAFGAGEVFRGSKSKAPPLMRG